MSAAFTPAHRGGSGPPLVCIHGFTDTWRTWELVLPRLEERHDVLAPTLPGHAGGAPLEAPMTDGVMADAVERAMDEAGFATAHLVGNSLGGYVALQLAARGRADSVVALAPAGGWSDADPARDRTLRLFLTLHEQTRAAAPHADAIAASPEGRRRATQLITMHFEHLSPELVAHQIVGAAACEVRVLAEHARRSGYPLDAEAVSCPLRIVWGANDRLLAWPSAAEKYRAWFPGADWIELDGVGHCPQLDVPLETSELILGFTAPR